MKALLLLFATAVWAADGQGIRPRSDVRLFHDHSITNGYEIGAAVLTIDQVKNSFSADLNRGYVVLEIAVYPKNGQPVEVRLADFALGVPGTGQVAQAVSASTIAGILRNTAPSRATADIYPVIGIGYESGSRYDPETGTRRRGGFYSTTGVAVGVGQSHPASTDQDRRTIELELSEKGLPEGPSVMPVAGYAYFPLTSKKKNLTYELEFYSPAGPVKLIVGRR